MNAARPILLAILLLAGACRSPGGELTRWYTRPPDMVSRVAAQLLLDLGFTIERDTHDDAGAEIVARGPAPERRRISACFRLEELDQTAVHLDLDRRDRRLGEQLLALISVRVSEESARAPPVVRATVEGAFDGSLDDGLRAVDVALEKIGAALVEHVVQPNAARAEARGPNDTVFEIAIIAERDTLTVQFTAGAEDKEDAQRRLEELKSEFRRALETAR